MKILNPPIKLCTEIIEFLYEFSSRRKDCGIDVFEHHFQVSSRYLKLALSFLFQNNLIIYSRPKIITLSEQTVLLLDKSSYSSKKVILNQLMTFQPFIEYIYFLGKGKTEKASVQLVISLYDLRHDEKTVSRIFKEWIKALGITISYKPLKNTTIDGIKESLQNKLYANNFIKGFLGDDLRHISEQVVSELSDAIKEIPQDNEASVNEAGKALEDFLRVDLAKDINLTNCSGVAEIGNELNRYSQYPKKLNNLCVGLSNIRSMGKAHGSDKVLKTKWNITEASAIGYVILILSTIKSYLKFKQESKLIF